MDPERARNLWKSERLVFRSISQDDQEWMFNEIESDPVNMSLSTPLLLAPPRRKKGEEWMEMWKGPSHLLLAVICLAAPPPAGGADEQQQQQQRDRPDKPPAGAAAAAATATATATAPTRIGVLRLSYNGYGTSPHNRACDLGITLAAAHQGRGYGTEAVGWALDWAFRHAGAHSVNLGSVAYNARAHRCYERCGFRLEGRRRECCWHDRRWWDLLFFGILEGEWEEMRRSSGGTSGGAGEGVRAAKLPEEGVVSEE